MSLTSSTKLRLLGLCLALSVPGMAAAVPIDIADMDAGHTLLNFDELADGTVVANQYAGQGVTISGTLGNNGMGGPSSVLAADTGSAFSGPIYIGQPANSWNGSIVFDFAGVFVDQFGLMNVDSAGAWLSVYSGDTLVETLFASGALYDFIGIDTGGINITRAVISGDFYAVDDVRFNAAAIAVPEPASLTLLGIGLFGLGLSRRRKRTA